jgi:hypothetical protein
MMNIAQARIVKLGEWFYDGTTPCRIAILTESLLPGSGDHEDPEEIASDRNVPCFSVWFENPARKGEYNAGGGHYLTVEDAMESAEMKINGQVHWSR